MPKTTSFNIKPQHNQQVFSNSSIVCFVGLDKNRTSLHSPASASCVWGRPTACGNAHVKHFTTFPDFFWNTMLATLKTRETKSVAWWWKNILKLMLLVWLQQTKLVGNNTSNNNCNNHNKNNIINLNSDAINHKVKISNRNVNLVYELLNLVTIPYY